MVLRCDICGRFQAEENDACPQHRMWRFERERDEAREALEAAQRQLALTVAESERRRRHIHQLERLVDQLSDLREARERLQQPGDRVSEAEQGDETP